MYLSLLRKTALPAWNLPVVFLAAWVVLLMLQIRAARRHDEEEEEDAYIPPQTQARRPVQQPERDPYDYREEISRVATEYSRVVTPKTERKVEAKPVQDDDDEVATVYKARREQEPTTKRG